jgi:hypothetical protein
MTILAIDRARQPQKEAYAMLLRRGLSQCKCQACRSLQISLNLHHGDIETIRNLPWHESLASLEASATEGCRTCGLVRRTIWYEQPTWSAICNLRNLNACVSISHVIPGDFKPDRLYVRYGPSPSEVVIVEAKATKKRDNMGFWEVSTRGS